LLHWQKYDEVLENDVSEKDGDLLQEIQETREINGYFYKALLMIDEVLHPGGPKTAS